MTSENSTKFIVSGSEIRVLNLTSDSSFDKLPPKVYSVQRDLFGFYLATQSSQFTVPSRIYGSTQTRVEKCLNTYKARPGSTGILLTGDKGTGKSLLTALLANRVITELNLPVIQVREGFVGEDFETFIQTLGECCIIFDEFGKVYDPAGRRVRDDDDEPISSGSGKRPAQDRLLSLLDGVDKKKRLFLLTENSEFNISEFLINRPSRVYYHFRYHKMEEDGILDYCQDHNVPTEISEEIILLCRQSLIFSFDILQAIVEEFNRYQTPVKQLIKELNIEEVIEPITMEIVKVMHGVTNEECKVSKSSKVINKPEPYRGYSHISFDKNGGRDRDLYFTHSDLKYQNGNELVFERENYVVVAKELPRANTRYHYHAF